VQWQAHHGAACSHCHMVTIPCTQPLLFLQLLLPAAAAVHAVACTVGCVLRCVVVCALVWCLHACLCCCPCMQPCRSSSSSRHSVQYTACSQHTLDPASWLAGPGLIPPCSCGAPLVPVHSGTISMAPWSAGQPWQHDAVDCLTKVKAQLRLEASPWSVSAWPQLLQGTRVCHCNNLLSAGGRGAPCCCALANHVGCEPGLVGPLCCNHSRL
jgi:hypothetical protein